MGELSAVLGVLASENAAGRAAVLATVVGVTGSGYRRPGARMVVTASGQRTGSVSGGCLEDDICRRAWWLTESGPALVAYDTADDGDGPYRLGCGGTVRVLVERVGPESAELHALRDAVTRGDSVAVATVIDADEQFPLQLGTRWVVGYDSVGEPPFMMAEAGEALRAGKSRAIGVEVGGGRGEVFIEVIRPPTRLALFGAGPDVGPVVRLAKSLGWHVTVIDRRPAETLQTRFPEVDEAVAANPGENFAGLDCVDAAVVMTHSFPDDFGWLGSLLASSTRYIGVLGARHRTERLVSELGAADDRVHGPVGLDIGADTPAEIALAIVAEIRAVLAGRDGGHLRDRDRPIHDPSPIPRNLVDGPRVLVACAVASP